MLRGLQLIGVAERQVTDLTANSSITHEPATPSLLMRGMSVSEESASDARGMAADPEEAKED